MALNDIGIDLGTTSVIIYDTQGNLLLKEASVVAMDSNTNQIITAGEEARVMLGRTPDRIRAAMPLANGVISDFDMTTEMLKHFIRKIYPGSLVKPRAVICVPSGVTEVESNAVVDSAIDAGMRKVFLIEEPVAAALGCDIDIARPEGHIIVDIGGGTSDVAVLSLNGVVCKTSVRTAGNSFDDVLVRYMRHRHNLLIGNRVAERAKIEVGSVCFEPGDNRTYEMKGRNLRTGLPGRQTITREEICPLLLETAQPILAAVHHILEITPPELSADLHHNGIVLTGGGSLLHGLDTLMAKQTGLRVQVAENTTDCVARGAARAFAYLDQFADGFIKDAIKSR